ncbi:hypothetical protein [Actinacidiphila yeochonensis]|uniref:hypothetical protein n=1 Tax=Actinacidiphila yeochonensis TaxID=89050 RepID=UPI0018E2D349|nr:hypothetical protein [Actinacidiphila yeochonensis]
MTFEQLATLATFGSTWAVLAVGHNVADHVFGQSDHQAANKGAPTAEDVAAGASPRRGWAACLAHVGQYHLVMAALLALVWLFIPLPLPLPLPLSVTGLTAGFMWSAATHAVLDRRWPVRWLLQHTGSPAFAELRAAGLNGMYLADQALHSGALLVSALLITRPASEVQVEGVEPVHHREAVRGGRRRVSGREDPLAGRRVHRPRRVTALAVALPLRVPGRPQPADHRRGLGLGGLFPPDVDRPQYPEPAQQIEGVAPTCQRTHIPEQPIPQIRADRLDLPTRSVHYHPRQRHRRTRDHRPDACQPYSTIHQIPMNTGDLMRQRHAQMLQNRRHRVEPVSESVQSTDQAWHHCSPRTRGWSLPSHAGALGPALLPACAGMSLTLAWEVVRCALLAVLAGRAQTMRLRATCPQAVTGP